MNNFELFRTKMSNENECRQKFENRFITDGAAPIIIHILRLDKDRDATMVFTDAEGPDSAIVFTPKQYKKDNNLTKTDYYTWEDKLFFVYEDVLIAREVSYIKQRAYQCNVKVKVIGQELEEQGAYFISSLRSYVDNEFQQKLNITDKEQPILIIPQQSWIKIGVKLSIGGKPWKIIDYDAITNDGIVYISLERDFYTSQNTDILVEESSNVLKSGNEYSFITSDGYFNTSSPLQIKIRTKNKIIAEIPYGLTEIEIETKINDKIEKQKYKVVI